MVYNCCFIQIITFMIKCDISAEKPYPAADYPQNNDKYILHTNILSVCHARYILLVHELVIKQVNA